ncbi:hypothetical protein K3728_14160 [Rhodobacteraceae bacterium M385]|nr:hypothetical protein K3728_14160 [Rhodobacteraceae bacterium M385]
MESINGVVLPFFDRKGAPINDPSLLLFAAAAAPDIDAVHELHNTLQAITQSEAADPTSKASRVIRKQLLYDGGLRRSYAGAVVLELAAHYLETAGHLALNNAYERVAEHMRTDGRSNPVASLNTNIRQAFKEFRANAHILAATECWPESFENIELCNVCLESTLRRARWFEQYLDNYFDAHKSSSWAPLRIPAQLDVARITRTANGAIVDVTPDQCNQSHG